MRIRDIRLPISKEGTEMSLTGVNFGLAVEFVKNTFENAIVKIDDPLSDIDEDNLIEGLIFLILKKKHVIGVLKVSLKQLSVVFFEN